MNKKTRVTVIGNYLEPLERPLMAKGIFFDVFINGCSPFAMSGALDETKLKHCDVQDISMSCLLNIRKNLSQMLSRDPKNFCQNYNIQPHAKEVRYQNDSEYIVIMNTSVGYALFEKKGIVYSAVYPANQFMADVGSDKSFNKLIFPFSDNFNWKYYYNNFIDAILQEYDSEHIILIKTNSAQWFMDGQEIMCFDNRSSQYRNRVEQIDEYFIEKTHCLCIDDHYNHIPNKNDSCAFTYARMSKLGYKKLEKHIESIVNGEAESFRPHYNFHTNPLAKIIDHKLSIDILKENSDSIEFVSDNWLSFWDIGRKSLEQSNEFFANIIKLKKFLDTDNGYTLSDYAIELLSDKEMLQNNIDLELVKLYTKYMKLNINDIIAVYMLYLQCENKAEFREIAKNMVNNSDCLPVVTAKRFRKENIDFLKDYPYIHSELIEDFAFDRVYVCLENNVYIIINPFSETPLQKVEINIDNTVDHTKIINNGYVCPIGCADALCSSYAFYIERAKRSDGNVPVKVIFDRPEDFYETLSYIDYQDILENEKFVISTARKEVDTPRYRSICDLSFLFKKNVRICVIRSGLADQICYYIFSKKLEEAESSLLSPQIDIYYDNTFYLFDNAFNGLEIQKVVDQNLDDRLMTNLLSPKLLSQLNSKMLLADMLYQNGCDNLCAITCDQARSKVLKYCNNIFLPFKPAKAKKFWKHRFDFSPLYYYCFIRPDMISNDFDLEKYIHFPDFEDETNCKIAEKMLSCDAVAIHVRLGDRAGTKFVGDNKFYVDSIQNILELPDYKNKKYFIFSDNIPWIKEHPDGVGLDLVEDSEIIYIDHNKGEESYRDIQLISLAKIVIVTGGGFSRTAALLSKRCEIFYLFNVNADTNDFFAKLGRKNKGLLSN